MGDAVRSKCTCMRCRMRGLMWPTMLITLGVLFLVAEYSSRYSFRDLVADPADRDRNCETGGIHGLDGRAHQRGKSAAMNSKPAPKDANTTR